MGAFIDMTGLKFGKLTIVGYKNGSRLENRRSQRVCICECGREVLKTDKYLRNNKSPSCGKCKYEFNTKVCCECKIEKDKSEFHKLNSKKIGIQYRCKECISASRKEIYWNNREVALVKMTESRVKPANIRQRKTYYERNKEKYKERYVRYMADDSKKAHKNETRLKYKESNNEKMKAQKKEYSQRPEVKKRKRLNHQKRKETDIQYVIKRRLRFRLRHIIIKLGNKKFKQKSALDLLGCDMLFLKAHLESQFKDGMCWERISEIDIDHIKPCIKYDLTLLSEQLKCFHYSNLQPLWRLDNMIKGHSYTEPIK